MPRLSNNAPQVAPKQEANHVKTALVTGAAKRIGRAIALNLAQNGWDVALHVRSDDGTAEAVRNEIVSYGQRAAIVSADLSNTAETAVLFENCNDQLGPLTCLVNNASLFEDDAIGNLKHDLWDAHLAINLRSPVFLAQALLSQLPDDQAGNVINIVDQRVWRLTPEFFSYTVSKSALWAATQTMAMAMAPRIRVNAIGPGPVLQSIHQTEADFAAEVASVPLLRGASPEEIAKGVQLILETPAMTGQMIALDGGQHLL
ncbi:MAG: SDR family oxidoreductase [Pseudomonadota bacterium]